VRQARWAIVVVAVAALFVVMRSAAQRQPNRSMSSSRTTHRGWHWCAVVFAADLGIAVIGLPRLDCSTAHRPRSLLMQRTWSSPLDSSICWANPNSTFLVDGRAASKILQGMTTELQAKEALSHR